MKIFSDSDSQKLEFWIRRLTRRDMPIFSQTAQKISIISAMSQCHAAELATAILQDALLTTRVLKLANSAYYMGGRKGFRGNSPSVNTVTRAVMILGFDTVRTICQTKALVEDMLKGVQRERLTQKMACSFHAAAQARWLAKQTGDESPEEIFIAAFLYFLGEMAFWCFADEAFAGGLEKAMAASETDTDRAAQELLGFRFAELTLALNKEWHLGPLLQETLEARSSTNPRIKKIFWGHQLAKAVQKGWQSTEVARIIDQMADSLTLSKELVLQMVHENAREAIHTALSYGAAKAGRLIPLPMESAQSGTLPDPLTAESEPEETTISRPDPALQIKILHDLSTLMLERKPDYSLFISLVLEGIFRAVGMDRVLFALCSPDRSRLEVKFQLGWQQETETSQTTAFESLPATNNLLGEILEGKQPFWFDGRTEPWMEGLFHDGITPLIGRHPFYTMPIVVHGKSIGLVYADRQPSGRELEEESFISFQHFCRQAIIGLSLITQGEKTSI